MIERRAVVLALVLGLLPTPPVSAQQPTGQRSRIGVLVPAEPQSAGDPNVAAFRQALRELGYIEGQTIAVEYRYAHGKAERLDDLAAELVRLPVDVLVVGSGAATLAAKRASTTVPIVFTEAGDPVGSGLVASLAHPGGNVTGLSFAWGDGFAGKWVELLAEAVPGITRVAALRDPSNLMSAQFSSDIQVAARRLGLTLRPFEVRDAGQLENAFAGVAADRAEGLIVDPGILFHAHHRRTVALAAKHRRPTIYGFRVFVEAGGLMSYSISQPELWRRAARYVDRILKGTKPADLPVEQSTKFELVVNLRTARTLGLTMPASLILRADAILE